MARMTATASGAIASFKSPRKAPIRSLKVYFSPKQEGTGDPSPSNERPISGWTGIKVSSSGSTNLWRASLPFDVEGLYGGWYIPHTSENMTITLIDKGNDADISGLYFGSGATGINQTNVSWLIQNGTVNRTVSTTTNRYLCIYGKSEAYFNKLINRFYVMVNDGSTSKPYIEYIGNSSEIDFSLYELGTIYGGWVDLITGNMTIEYTKRQCNDPNAITTIETYASGNLVRAWLYLQYIDVPSSEFISSNKLKFDGLGYSGSYVSSNASPYIFGGSTGYPYSIWYWLPYNVEGGVQEATTSGIKTWFDENSVYFIGKLKTPVTYQLTPQQLETLKGLNTFWSNADRVEVEYDLAESVAMMNIKWMLIGNMALPKDVPVGTNLYANRTWVDVTLLDSSTGQPGGAQGYSSFLEYVPIFKNHEYRTNMRSFIFYYESDYTFISRQVITGKLIIPENANILGQLLEQILFRRTHASEQRKKISHQEVN